MPTSVIRDQSSQPESRPALLVSVPTDSGSSSYYIGGLAFGNGDLWAISEEADGSGRHQLSEINPANGNLVQQLFVSVTTDGGSYYYIGGLAWQ